MELNEYSVFIFFAATSTKFSLFRNRLTFVGSKTEISFKFVLIFVLLQENIAFSPIIVIWFINVKCWFWKLRNKYFIY